MKLRDHYVALGRNPSVKLVLFIVGCILLGLSPLVGVIPGPGGIFVAAAGLTLMLRNSRWAKRQYVRFKRRQPRAGGWMDWGMRRASHRRREELKKAVEPSPPPLGN